MTLCVEFASGNQSIYSWKVYRSRLQNPSCPGIASVCPQLPARQAYLAILLALQITFRNKIPSVGILRRPALITSFGDEHGLPPLLHPIN